MGEWEVPKEGAGQIRSTDSEWKQDESTSLCRRVCGKPWAVEVTKCASRRSLVPFVVPRVTSS